MWKNLSLFLRLCLSSFFGKKFIKNSLKLPPYPLPVLNINIFPETYPKLSKNIILFSSKLFPLIISERFVFQKWSKGEPFLQKSRQSNFTSTIISCHAHRNAYNSNMENIFIDFKWETKKKDSWRQKVNKRQLKSYRSGCCRFGTFVALLFYLFLDNCFLF